MDQSFAEPAASSHDPSPPVRRTRRPSQPDPFGDLVTDHRRLRRLLARLARAQDPGVRELLFQDVQDELHVHFRLEDDVLFPAFRDATKRPQERRMYFHAREEHAGIDRLIEAMRRTDTSSESFAAQATLLELDVARHVADEERRIFPAARRLLRRSGPELQRMMRRRRAAMLGQAPADPFLDWPEGLRGPER